VEKCPDWLPLAGIHVFLYTEHVWGEIHYNILPPMTRVSYANLKYGIR